ncbi:TonB-dependent receptor [Pseudomaricurvus sp. HS19]|uniref:TonB-dependent receptor n=1 Tax=Pseudomaricurvus sp. HS19 TaxID=2692626 RepID=UPI00136D75EE|nr:TonB-dependent receptor [Pseudomaricurvus sp. HS19]MYM64499.1 TonB-dependent receptor [Pseudomaricurvus sp. HS19]
MSQSRKALSGLQMPCFRKAVLPACIAAVASSAVAQDETTVRPYRPALEEVTVTATKREATIQDLPFSINAQTQEDIQRSGSTSLEDLSRNVAGLTIQNLGPGQSQVAIRGVSAGQIVRDQPGVKEQVGVYLDESVISLSLFTPDLDLFDLNRVETLRGPQGTLFGSGSMGGTVRYITNQPSFDGPEGMIEANLNTVTDGEEGGHLKGMYNLPLTETLALRVVGYTTEYAGFIDALGENGSKKEDVNDGNRSGGRIALTWEPTDNFSITPRVVYQKIEMDGFNRQEVYNLYANPYTTTRPAITFDEREQYLLLDEAFEDETMIADVVMEWSLGSVDITSISSYTEREILVSRDASALTGSISIRPLDLDVASVLLPSNLLDTTDLEQFTQEIRLSSDYDGAFQWLVGVFYSDTTREYSQRLPTPGYDAFVDAKLGANTSASVANGFPADSPYNADYPFDLEQFAVFGEVNFDITERLHMTVGGRWYDFEESRRFTTGGIFSNQNDQVDDTTSDGFTPRVLASYDLNDEVVLNAQVAQGFRLGGVNDPLNAPLCEPEDLATYGGNPTYDDETMWNYEVGMKGNWGDFSLNVAAFYADISDLQATLDAGSCSSRVSVNVPDAHTAGIEFELGSQLTDALYLAFSGSVLEAEFDSTVRDVNGNVLGGIEDGNRLASVPEVQLSLSGTYTFLKPILRADDSWVSASVQYVGDRITQPGDQVSGAGDFTSELPYGGATGDEVTSLDLELDAYAILNLNMGLIYDTLEMSVYMNNVTDENADLSLDRERGGSARLAFATNQPRTLGVTVRKSF